MLVKFWLTPSHPPVKLKAMALPSPILGSVFMDTEIPAPTQLLHGIVDQGGKLSIGGGSKSYKSWIFADLALSIATGQPWLDFDTGDPQPVLYMNFEIPPYHFQQRLEAISKARDIEVPDELIVWNLRGYAAGYNDVEKVTIEQAKAHKAAMVITDPLYKIMGSNTDENAAGDMAKLFNSLERVAVETGAAVAYAGHFSKGNQSAKNPIDRVSGSGVHGRDPDTIINFTRHKEEDAYTVDFTLRCYAPVSPFVVRWVFPLMVRADDLNPLDLQKKPNGRPAKLTVGHLLAILRTQRKIIDDDTFFALAEAAHKISRKTFNRVLPELVLLPGVRHLPDGQWIYTN